MKTTHKIDCLLWAQYSQAIEKNVDWEEISCAKIHPVMHMTDE